ncbi:hypothetical protein CJ030_MR7G016901 [Morella rubra]|uniref:Uncharacterized protein n=1 Tax=Morella rubra TaxID=262757 RepID=A0A6A1V026_9ROSI|nr:hypothetical protein CJ030_MR7G016901 [Morella rubra]
MTSSTGIPNGDLAPLVVNQELIPNSDALLATLVQTVENVTSQINTIPPPKPSPSIVSPSHEETTDKYSAHQSPSKQCGADAWRAALYDQMSRQVKQIRLLQQKLSKVENHKTNDSSIPTNVSSSPFTLKVLACPLPPCFQPSQIDLFDGTATPTTTWKSSACTCTSSHMQSPSSIVHSH